MTDVVLRGYAYDALARPSARSLARQAGTRQDAFAYNTRSELSGAELGTDSYGYTYDNIGNRKTAQELADELTYAANNLNQYSSITKAEDPPFVPTFDADGNQTRIQTSTGIWTAVYDAENRPVRLESEDGPTVIECGYDYLGRRYMKRVTRNGVVTKHERYIYRGYLQIAALDLKRAAHPALWYILWDPAEAVATRPLAIQKDGTWYTYGHDLTKNVWELYKANGTIATAYDYAPFGEVTANGTAEQPFQWSSEFYDAELGMVYYNFRFYNPLDGRWISRDAINELISNNLYCFSYNRMLVDYLGLLPDILPRYCHKDLTRPRTIQTGCEQCIYECECPEGYTAGIGSYSIIKRPCTYPDTIESGSCRRYRSTRRRNKRTIPVPQPLDGNVQTEMEMEFRNRTADATIFAVHLAKLLWYGMSILMSTTTKNPVNVPLKAPQFVPKPAPVPVFP